MPTLEIHPPSYPLDRAAFRRALATGHGRAMIHAKRHGVGEYRDEVLDACSRCLVYDPQSNGYREDWLASLCHMAGCVDEVMRRGIPDADDHDLGQFVRLMEAFHRRGIQGALKILKELSSHPDRYSAEMACGSLVEILGEEGLVFSAEILGKRFSSDPDFWTDGGLMWAFDHDHGEGRARGILTTATMDHPEIARYLREVDSLIARRESRASFATLPPDKAADQEDGMDKLPGVDLYSRAMASAHRFLGGLESSESLSGLMLNEEAEIRRAAAGVFADSDDERIRPLALQALERGWLNEGLEAITLTAREEDLDAILVALATHPWGDDDDIHELFSHLLKLMEEGPRLCSPELARIVHEFTPCMHCRQASFTLLFEWNACPAWVREEAAKDASESIREVLAAGSSDSFE